MLEIIPTHQLKIIPWPKKEKLIILRRAENRILFMGLESYLRGAKKKKQERRGRSRAMQTL